MMLQTGKKAEIEVLSTATAVAAAATTTSTSSRACDSNYDDDCDTWIPSCEFYTDVGVCD